MRSPVTRDAAGKIIDSRDYTGSQVDYEIKKVEEYLPSFVTAIEFDQLQRLLQLRIVPSPARCERGAGRYQFRGGLCRACL